MRRFSSTALGLFAVLHARSTLALPQGTPPAGAPAEIPTFVYEYAPVVWLHSKETYNPADIAQQLVHTVPRVNFAELDTPPKTLRDLDELNGLGGGSVYLTSKDDITTNPAWLNGVAPDADGKTNDAVSAVIVITDKGDGVVDAFYFYFYANNWGGIVLGLEVNNHVGDWEHNMIRFRNGVPQTIWYSQHGNGQAFTYNAVSKKGKRPVAYSAMGSHANYATWGFHEHTIPNFNSPLPGLLNDVTDQGKLWDPTLNAYKYRYEAATDSFTGAAGFNPVGFMNYVGRWGDERYPDSDPRQSTFLGIDATAKFTSGPSGPRDKQLNRADVCPANGNACIVRPILMPRRRRRAVGGGQ
ncbi:MAG: hypothetical protein M1832_003355 [Thelocarpon impressellum]|nr:MAG: hypothetical protein M1832_003355 [Thelocarpon impressellum]